MSAGLRRPKTAGGAVNSFRQLGDVCDGALPAAGTTAGGGGRLPRRSGSQMSLKSGEGNDSCWPQYVPIRRVPSALKRNREIQTESNAHLPAASGVGVSAVQQGDPVGFEQPLSGAALFYPYYVPGLQQENNQQQQQQPYVLLSPWQLPGYQNLPVLDPSQLRLLDSMGLGRRGSAPPRPAAPTYRSGRNGSCWRHIRQCTGNLGNNIMFVDGHVKEDDCQRFPPHGYPGASTAGLSVYGRLAPKAQPRMAAGISLGNSTGNPARLSQQSLAMERAKAGTKYWFEDNKPAPMIPNTIQGRIMKNGSAY